MKVREFAPADRCACLALFDSNVPEFFLATERDAFSEFLESADFRPPRLRAHGDGMARFLVLEGEKGIVGCGGWYLEGKVAGLTWGIVSRSEHRKGIGRLLLQERLDGIRRDGHAKLARVYTTPAVQGFFEHVGFRLVRRDVAGVVHELPLVELVLSL